MGKFLSRFITSKKSRPCGVAELAATGRGAEETEPAVPEKISFNADGLKSAILKFCMARTSFTHFAGEAPSTDCEAIDALNSFDMRLLNFSSSSILCKKLRLQASQAKTSKVKRKPMANRTPPFNQPLKNDVFMFKSFS